MAKYNFIVRGYNIEVSVKNENNGHKFIIFNKD